MSLAFGKPAILMDENSRTGVFKRFRLDCRPGKVMILEPSLITHEKDMLLNYLRRCFKIYESTKLKVC